MRHLLLLAVLLLRLLMVLLKVGLVVTGGHVCRQVLLLHDLLGAVISLPCVVRWLYILAVRFHLVDA